MTKDKQKSPASIGSTEEKRAHIAASAFEIKQRRLILFTAVTANLLGNVGLIGINVALPSIQKEMSLGAVQMAWVSLATMLVMAMFSAPMARVSDLVGRKRVTIVGLWVTIIASAGCALSGGFWTLIFFRALTGLGLVSFFTTVTTMITAAYPANERGRVLGLSIASVYIGLSFGPIVSGFIVEYLGWQAIFWFTVVGMLPPMALIHMVKRDPPTTPDEKLDKTGVALWMLGVAIGFIGLASLGKTSAVHLLVIGLLLGALFVIRTLKSPNPIVDMRLFLDSRRFSFSSLAAYISYLSSTSGTFLLSLYLQYSRGLSPSGAGLFLIAQPVVQAFLTPIAGRMSDRYDAGRLASAGMTVIMTAILLFAFNLGSDTPTALLIFTMSLTGAGFAFFSAPNTNAIMSAVPRVRLGQASGVITVTRLFGQISSIALITIVFSVVIGPGEITEDKYQAFITASRICFFIFAPLCFTGILASLARGRKIRVEEK
ncbi:MAG: MFS transporter [Deltaproteobacteria bacterium]|jgi:MFS family permease|nr:MFS transporter [Deltaproteobacteria bacterium]